MINTAKHGLISISAMIALGLIVTATAAADQCTIWEDFNDGNADGWFFDWDNPWDVSFPSEECREKYLRMAHQSSSGNNLFLLKELFSFNTSNIVVEFDTRASTSGGSPTGSTVIAAYQHIDDDNSGFDTIRWGAYNDSYSRHYIDGSHTPHDAAYPPIDRTTWTRFRIEWSAGAVHTMSFTENFENCLPVTGSWTQWYSHDHDMPDLPLGSSFRFLFGGSAADAVFDLDNVSVTPEPATLSLLAFGGLAMLRRRRVRVGC